MSDAKIQAKPSGIWVKGRGEGEPRNTRKGIAKKNEHHAQAQNYLKATRLQLGLLMHFGHYPKLELDRIASTRERFGQQAES